ncbi:MAG: hypothetical protein WBV91_15140, partial [Desulfobacterales bacterium]
MRCAIFAAALAWSACGGFCAATLGDDPAKWVLQGSCARAGYSYLDRVFLPVVNKGDRLVG